MKNPLSPDISVFVEVADRNSFAAVADQMGYSSSGISRMISRLEDSLGAKLFYRSTRRLSLTPEGEVFLAYAREILSTLEAAEADVSKTLGRPRGHVRVNCGTALAHYKLAQILPAFLEEYPDISLDLSVNDRRIDPISEQIDITLRVGSLEDSDLVAIRLGTVKRVIAASPDYLAEHGTPRHPDELIHHNCLLLTGFPGQAVWPMKPGRKPAGIAVTGSFSSDSAEALLKAAVSGAGIIRLGDFLGEEALASGQLVPVLADWQDETQQPITALVLPGRHTIPRIRALLDFLKQKL